MKSFRIRTKKDMKDAVKACGILPLFENSLPGFSIEEHVAASAWFSGNEGVWEWKGPVIQEVTCAYGKFFEHKAAFITEEWFYDFANYRRDGYDFDARYEDGLASIRDKELFELVQANEGALSKELKHIGNYRKGGKKGFDTIITRLQAQGYVLTSDFSYLTDRYGNEYGWGVARYMTPESYFGKRFSSRVYKRTPEESYKRLLAKLKKLVPDADDAALKKFLA